MNILEQVTVMLAAAERLSVQPIRDISSDLIMRNKI
jgi:hypothetical protein